MSELNRSSFYDRFYLWIFIASLISIYPITLSVIKSEETNNNNIKQWLPKDNFDETKIYAAFRAHFGTDEYAIVSWTGCTLTDPRLSEFASFARNYQNASGDKLFAKVTTGPELLEKLQAKPFDLSERLARQRLESILIGKDGESSAAVIELTEAGDNDRREAIASLRSILIQDLKIPAAEIHMAGDAVTNAAVDVESQRATDSLVGYSMLIALSCAVTSFFFAHGRRSKHWIRGLTYSFTLAMLIFFVSVYSAMLAQSLVPIFGGRVNLVLVVMPVLIYVLSLSAGVHLINYYQDTVREKGVAHAPATAIRLGWMPCTLAAGTTAIGLGSLSVSNIIPVKDFGKFSAIGIIASLGVLFLLLPALLVLIQRFSKKANEGLSAQSQTELQGIFDQVVEWLAAKVIAHRWPVLCVCIGLLIFFGCGSLYINTSVKPARFFDPKHRLITDYEWLASPERFGNQIPLEIVVAFNRKKSTLTTLGQMRLISAIEKDLKQNQSNLISHSISAATFAPELDEGHYTQFVMNKRLAANRADYHKVHYYSYENAAHEVAPVPHATDKAKGGTEDEPQAGKDLWRISARIRPGEKDYDEVILQIEEHVNGFLAKRSAASQQKQKKAKQTFEKFKELVKQKIAEESAACTESENKQGCLEQIKQKYDLIVTNRTKKFDNFLRAAADDAVGVDVQYTGMVPLFHIAQRELLNGLFKSFVIAFFLIAVMMIIWFRNFASGLVSMLPNVFPAAVIFGWMGWTDRIVDIGSMMTASVAMGIAVDDTVHFLTWFRRGIAAKMTRAEAVLYCYRRCALAMTQTTLIAGLGLVIFSLSSFQPVSQFGLLMFLLLLAALVGDLVFLPSLLASPAGKLFQVKSDPSAPR
ncbi:MAG: hypothetical protein CMJ74_08210 [Planctomycetaceae bacterium]|nr:hypothetical protein [Planctomycetaceae bacterium]